MTEPIKKEEWQIKPGIDKEIIFQNGWKGIFSVAGKETQELSLWDLEVAGRKFACTKEIRKEFEEFLVSLPDPEVNVMWMYSTETKLPSSWKGRKKKNNPEPILKEKTESIHYNCTIRVPKQYVQPMFDDVTDRCEKFCRLLAEMLIKQHEKDLSDKSCEI